MHGSCSSCLWCLPYSNIMVTLIAQVTDRMQRPECQCGLGHIQSRSFISFSIFCWLTSIKIKWKRSTLNWIGRNNIRKQPHNTIPQFELINDGHWMATIYIRMSRKCHVFIPLFIRFIGLYSLHLYGCPHWNPLWQTTMRTVGRYDCIIRIIANVKTIHIIVVSDFLLYCMYYCPEHVMWSR